MCALRRNVTRLQCGNKQKHSDEVLTGKAQHKNETRYSMSCWK